MNDTIVMHGDITIRTVEPIEHGVVTISYYGVCRDLNIIQTSYLIA